MFFLKSLSPLFLFLSLFTLEVINTSTVSSVKKKKNRLYLNFIIKKLEKSKTKYKTKNYRDEILL